MPNNENKQEDLRIIKYGELSSGETTLLEQEQEKFNSWLKDEDVFWNYELYFDDDLTLQNRFFQYVAEHIKSIPPQRFLLRYFLNRYRIALGGARLRGIYDYVEKGKWRITRPHNLGGLYRQIREKLANDTATATVPLSKSEYNQILSAICYALEIEYSPDQKKAVCGNTIKWNTYFNKFFKKPSNERLRELALALNWDWNTYTMFRKKALKQREINYLDRDEILLLLSLKYAPECGLPCYPAYCILKLKYPGIAPRLTPDEARKLLSPDTPETSKKMELLLLQALEENGHLRPKYQRQLFHRRIPSIEKILSQLQLLRAAKKTRSCQEILIAEWAELTKQIIKEDFPDADTANQKRHEIFRFLYGEKVEKQVTGTGPHRINDLNDDDMLRIAPGIPDYYLDSQEFLDTRIRDNDFYAKTFTVDETRQRNILLTVIFLNFLSTLDYYKDYSERLVNFDMKATDILEECGFVSLYSGYAYDALLKLLLSCNDPKGLFQFIWHVKTGSYKG